ncbi:MAG TPA: PepSY domain-containing protein [Burkholderiales bacterium]|nr:PepSY domain-containing protein [Burkholderiales bacterium]
MRALTLIHRWLGVAFCLLFAMWFASGIVMHFVPFPELTEAERVSGLAPIDAAGVRYGPTAATAAAGVAGATRVRLLARADGVVYLVEGASSPIALHAMDLSPARVQSESLALAIAADHARRRGMEAMQARYVELAGHDQWTVPNGLDPHRPLHRIALNDDAGTELYVSSATGEVVRDTTRRERWWNYGGSVVHWIYPTVLRRDWRAWDAVVWTLSLAALVTAISGALLGSLRIQVAHGRLVSSYAGWHAWHHWLGLSCMAFVLTWILSGWLSMDHGRLFSSGKAAASESAAFTGAPAWDLRASEIERISPHAREIEWFTFDRQLYRRERFGLTAQRLSRAGEASAPTRAYLQPAQITAAARRFAPDCEGAFPVPAADAYAMVPTMPGAPVYRVVCGTDWFHIDGASGRVLEKLDASRRAYRWVYGALHTLDFPALAARPALRTAVVVSLCAAGLAFSLTAVVIGWRRLRSEFLAPALRERAE